jgi:hypothetical protein
MGCSWVLYESGLWIACASRVAGYATGPYMLSRCGSNQAALMTSKFVPCTSTLIPNLLQTRFVTKVIIMIIMQAKHADVFMFSLEKMWRRRGGPIYGPIIGQR